jgi:hypothetical protein
VVGGDDAARSRGKTFGIPERLDASADYRVPKHDMASYDKKAACDETFRSRAISAGWRMGTHHGPSCKGAFVAANHRSTTYCRPQEWTPGECACICECHPIRVQWNCTVLDLKAGGSRAMGADWSPEYVDDGKGDETIQQHERYDRSFTRYPLWTGYYDHLKAVFGGHLRVPLYWRST